MSFHVPEEFRIRKGEYGSDESCGNNGAFWVRMPSVSRGYSTREFASVPAKVIASDGEGWEHVSVSFPTRCPSWAEMAHIKGLFWDAGDCVVQFHPPESEYVNNHPYCLHLWRPTGHDIPTPPSILVGYKDAGLIA